MRFFCLFFFIISNCANAQICSGPGRTPETAISVCGTLVFPQSFVNYCVGADIPNGGICGNYIINSSNSIWYRFHCYQGGTLGFQILPSIIGDDYDWEIMNITNRPPQDVFTTNLRVSLNFAVSSGATGCTPTGGTGPVDPDAICPVSGAPVNNRMPTLITGSDYLLMVTKVSTAGFQGFQLTFGGGTAVLTNFLPPSVTTVSQVGCSPNQIRINFSEDIKCSSVTPIGQLSEFVISNGTHTITNFAYSCNAGSNSFNTLTLTLQNPLPPGNYTLTVNQGFDGTTLLDVCDDQMVAGVPVPFTIPPQTPPTITQVTKANCAATILKVALSQPVQCTSISANGSEFSISPGGPTINSVTTNCSGTNLSTDTIYINLQNPLADGNYTLTVNNGTPDGNTFIDNCGIPMAVGTNRTFTIATTPAPTVTNPPAYCQGATAAALQANGTNLLWYTTATGGTGSATALIPSTTNAGTFNFYVSQTINGCEGPRAMITVIINPTPGPPSINGGAIYCTGQTAITLSAIGSNILWYTSSFGGVGSTIAPTPNTATPNITTFFASQTISGCESNTRGSVNVTVFPTPIAPTVISPIDICQGSTPAQLTAMGTNLLWYTSATGGTGSSTAPTPSTTTLGTTNYFVSQSNNNPVINCEGPRAQITVNIVTTPSAPTVSTPINYCQNQTSTPLTAGGSNLMWYPSATGGTGSSTAPTPATNTIGTTIFYVGQSAGTCQGPRSAITVNVAATPAAPAVMPQVNYCEGATASPLSAPGTNIKWYTTATGGTGSTSAPTQSTAVAGTTYYFVSQSIGICESPRAEIMVVVTAIPAAPMVGPTVDYCQ